MTYNSTEIVKQYQLQNDQSFMARKTDPISKTKSNVSFTDSQHNTTNQKVAGEGAGTELPSPCLKTGGIPSQAVPKGQSFWVPLIKQSLPEHTPVAELTPVKRSALCVRWFPHVFGLAAPLRSWDPLQRVIKLCISESENAKLSLLKIFSFQISLAGGPIRTE